MADVGPVPPAERIRFDDPAQVARAIADLPRPLLLGTDVDGTLSVLAATPGQAHLVDGADHALERLQECGVDVAVVSGRTVAELVHHFGMPADAHMIGSHGAEANNTMPRTDAESLLLQRVDEVLAGIAAEHPGALVERKPFASALHVRQCELAVGDRALRSVESAMAELSGVRVLPGDRVQEVMVRYTTKATALADLCRRLRPRSVVFLGDDVSDEHVFAAMAGGPTEIGMAADARTLGVRIGVAQTAASHRLASPHDVVAMLVDLAEMICAAPGPPGND